MGTETGISWTDSTWSPVTGCSKLSEACRSCYAEALSHRFKWTSLPWTEANAAENVVCHPDRLEIPLHWRKPRRVFVCSMGDLFHPQVPEEFLDRVFATMALCPQHTFLVLTKRPERMHSYITNSSTPYRVHAILQKGKLDWASPLNGEWPLEGVWLGVTTEDQTRADERIRFLLDTPAAHRFISCEPLLGPIDLTHVHAFHSPPWPNPIGGEPWLDVLRGEGQYPSTVTGLLIDTTIEARVDLVIAGGESGPQARPSHPDWFRSLRDQCAAAGVGFHFKQFGEYRFDLKWVGHYLSEPERLVTPRGNDAATLYPNEGGRAAWHTRDDFGFGGENGRCPTVEEARREAECAVIRQAINLQDWGLNDFRVGTKAAGRTLDGRTHDDMPGEVRADG